jgi:menaquinone-specific isochorismate synthase
MADLHARTRRLDADVDLVAVAGATGVLWAAPATSLAGRGEALRLTVDRTDPARCALAVHEALGAIAIDDDVRLPGTGVAALGAWPFDPAVAGELLVPAVTTGLAEDGTRWVTTVTDTDDPTVHDGIIEALLVDLAGDEETTLAGFSTAEPASPGSFTVHSVRPPTDWCAAVAAACAELRGGIADKVVLAREVLVEADAPLPVTAILRRLQRSFPEALRYSIDGYLGASPELLVSRAGDIVRCHPMAGTAPRSGDPAADQRLGAALLASTKNQAEHRHTIDLVHDTLIGYCSFLDEEAEPSIVAMANVQHLGTKVQGRLSDPPASVIELVSELHPTPAVCGRPRDAALDLIARHEDLDRGPYAGPVGWVDATGNGAWAVGIRGAVVDGARARVFAGVGVVADSDPSAELAETRAKLQAMLGALVRP